jgi:hypothetical protein
MRAFVRLGRRIRCRALANRRAQSALTTMFFHFKVPLWRRQGPT